MKKNRFCLIYGIVRLSTTHWKLMHHLQISRAWNRDLHMVGQLKRRILWILMNSYDVSIGKPNYTFVLSIARSSNERILWKCRKMTRILEFPIFKNTINDLCRTLPTEYPINHVIFQRRKCWERLLVPDTPYPMPKSRASMVAWRQYLVLFGGFRRPVRDIISGSLRYCDSWKLKQHFSSVAVVNDTV